MTLLDTNVIIDLLDISSPFNAWARSVLEKSVLSGGALVNVVTIAELISGNHISADLFEDFRDLGVEVKEIPSSAGEICGTAYRHYRAARKASGGGQSPATPLPDFFIGAHAEALGWNLATRDSQRFKTYFPNVTLIEP